MTRRQMLALFPAATLIAVVKGDGLEACPSMPRQAHWSGKRSWTTPFVDIENLGKETVVFGDKKDENTIWLYPKGDILRIYLDSEATAKKFSKMRWKSKDKDAEVRLTLYQPRKNQPPMLRRCLSTKGRMDWAMNEWFWSDAPSGGREEIEICVP